MSAKYPSWEPEYQRAWRKKRNDAMTSEEKLERKERRKKMPCMQTPYATKAKRDYFIRRPEKHAAKLAYQKRWYAANKTRLSAQMKAYRDANKDKIKARKAAADARNIETHRARRKRYYAENRERLIAKTAKWQRENPERMKRSRRERYAQPDCPRRGKTRQYSRKRIESGKAKAYGRKRMQQERANLTDFYVRQQLAKHSTLKAHQFPPEMVEAKRIQLKLKQTIKSYE